MITLSKIYKNYDNLKSFEGCQSSCSKRGDLWFDWEKMVPGRQRFLKLF